MSFYFNAGEEIDNVILFFRTKTTEQVISSIQLKLYTLSLKLQEYERKATGGVTDRFDCPEEFTPHWRRSQSPMAQHRRQLARSLSHLGPLNLSTAPRLSGSVPALPPRTPSATPKIESENSVSQNANNDLLERVRFVCFEKRIFTFLSCTTQLRA